MKKGSMFQKTRIRLTILNSLVFIILIGVLGSIIYSYTYKRIYSGVNESIEKAVQHRKNADDKNYLKKLEDILQLGIQG
ncbi:TPA: histidine kinase [Bacillus anthracis]|nr:histidine kinase [Bacillus anthracis]